MQTYLLNLTAAAPFTAYQTSGDLFVYESGSAGLDTAERRIIVKPDSGGEITLRPGQRFRLAPGQLATSWNVRTLDPSVALTGSLIIGAGEFDDANTLNTFKLDGTFTNTVSVNNTTANRVPVQLDPSTTINIAGTTLTYTNAYNDATTGAGTYAVITPAQNVNGLIVEFAELSIGTTSTGNAYGIVLLAKNAAPASEVDGDALLTLKGYSNSAGVNCNDRAFLPVRVKVAAGKGLYLVQSGVASSASKTVLVTLL